MGPPLSLLAAESIFLRHLIKLIVAIYDIVSFNVFYLYKYNLRDFRSRF
jgi:hypothetical protein